MDALRKPVWALGRAHRAVGGDGNRFLMGMGMLQQSFVLPQGTGTWRAAGLGLACVIPGLVCVFP